MTNSMLDAVNFDAVKNKYIEQLTKQGIKISDTPKSNDAFFVSGDGYMYFIEFKNGKIDNGEVRTKIFDSLLILTDIIEAGISYTRQNLNYILVYNETKNHTKPKGEELQYSPSRTKFAEHLIEKKAKKKFIRFNLEKFEKLYFKNVFTVTSEKFESDFVKKWD